MGSANNLAAYETWTVGKIVIYTSVNNLDFNPAMPGKDVDSCSSPEKIDHHLVSNFARICANAFVGYSVVCGSYVYPLFWNRGCFRFGDCRDSNPDLLEVSKTTRRLSQAKVP
jgi:hypothetical protein